DKDVVEVFHGDVSLDERLRSLLADHDTAVVRARRAREVFLESYSYAAVRPVATAAVEQWLDDPPALAPALADFVALPERMVSATPVQPTRPWPVRVPGRPSRPVPTGDSYDLVMFWKQNDSGIYGRRQDMLLKYLERSGRFGTIVHFDYPANPEGMWRW